MKHIYNARIFLQFAILFFLGVTQEVFSQTATLRIVGQPNCTQNQYTATIQIRAADATSFSIGTSSVYLTYNPVSLSLTSYQALNFAPNNLCIGGLASSWDNHTFDSTTPGIFNLTLTLVSNTFSCPIVTNSDWISIGTVTFTILNPNADPQLAFNSLLTNFNSAPANDGTNPILKGVFSGLSLSNLLSTVSLTAGASTCNPATNTYTLSGTAIVNNSSQPGILTLTTGALSQTVAVGSGASAVGYNFSGLASVGGTQTVAVTVPGCASASTTYAVPASCSAVPALPCNVAVALTPGSCNSATNQFTLTGSLSLTNITQATSVTITNGIQTVSGNIPVNATTLSFTMVGLNSDGQTRTITATFSGTACSIASQTYAPPISCTVASVPPCVVTVSATPSGCTPATNLFTVSGTILVSNGPATGVLTVNSGGQSTTIAVSSGITSYSYSLGGLTSNGATGQVTASFTGTTCAPVTQTFTAPASCSCTQAVINSVTANRATCNGQLANSDASIQFTATGGTGYLITGPGVNQNSPLPLVNGVGGWSNLPNPATTATYTISVLTNTSGPSCPAVQQTVTLQNVNCACPPANCVPVVAVRIR